MLPFYQNLPFFSIILAMLASIASPLFRKTRMAYGLTVLTTALIFVFSVIVTICTLHAGTSFTYWLGHFPAPWGNELRAGTVYQVHVAAFQYDMLNEIIAFEAAQIHGHFYIILYITVDCENGNFLFFPIPHNNAFDISYIFMHCSIVNRSLYHRF